MGSCTCSLYAVISTIYALRLAKLRILRSESETSRTNLISVERVVSEDAATIGVIGVQTKNVFSCPPLMCYPFNASSGQDQRKLNGSSTLITNCISLAHDERILAYATSAAIKLMDLQTGREMRTLVGHKGRVSAITQSNRSIYMWASAATDCTVTLWDTRQHPANVLVRRFDRSTNCLCYSPNDAFIALGSDHLYLIDPRVKEYRSLPSSSQVLHVCFHPSEYLLATGSEDRLVRFWDIDTEECVSQSDPADGTLRKVAFHNDGSALLTLTDRKCSAISWEPFEMLGQCIIPQTDCSLTLATSDSEVFVLGRSMLPSSLLLLMAPYAKLLVQEESLENQDRSDKLKVADKLDLSEASPGDPSRNELEEELLLEKKVPLHYYDDHSAFIPTHTLPRTPPQPVRVISRTEDATVAMTTTSAPLTTIIPMSAKTKTLKNRRNDANSKNCKLSSYLMTNFRLAHSKVASSSRRMSGMVLRTSQSSLSSRKGAHSHGAAVEVTNSMPDIRYIVSRKKEEKNHGLSDNDETKRQCQRKQLCRDHGQEIANESYSLGDVIAGLDRLEMIINQRRVVLEDVLRCWRTRGSEAAVTEAARSSDIVVLVELIDAFNHMPTVWNLTLCTAILPHIEPLFANKHEDYVEVALSALRAIITGCGDVIRTGSHRRFQIGVDVPAEERYNKCIKCMQQLTNIRVKATLLADRMNKSQSHEFTALMQIFDDTFSPS
uniref:WD_REPEATS_REGION domain-containing protein n=1 Tax=Elaeophora elaphi TaxID=1147741 RepID=A0A0R3RPI0_9BILA